MDKKLIKVLNDQIQAELHASFVYLSFYNFFNRQDVALANVAAFFKKSADEEYNHAVAFMDYLALRGEQATLANVQAPKNTKITLLSAFKNALALEKTVFKQIKKVYEVAEDQNDHHLADFLEGTFFEEQINAENELSRYITKIQRLGTGIGEHLFDQALVGKE